MGGTLRRINQLTAGSEEDQARWRVVLMVEGSTVAIAFAAGQFSASKPTIRLRRAMTQRSAPPFL
jgi:hypothetical protein